MTRAKSRKAYVLVLTLALLFCCILLLLSLTIYSQQATLIGNWGRQEFYDQRIAQGVQVDLEYELERNPSATPRVTRYPLDDVPMAGNLDWNKTSHYQPFQSDAISQLFGNWASDPPALGYSDDDKGNPTTPPWHALAVTGMPDDRDYQTVVSTAFPYGAFAPWGSVQVSGTVGGFANPDFKAKFDQLSNVPVRIAAGQDVTVSGQYRLGTVQSAEGKISLPRGAGALALPGLDFPDPFTQTIHDQVTGSSGLIPSIGSNLCDKTDFVTGSELDPEGLYKLISGKENLTAIFSLQQACSIPMPILPSIIDGEGYQVILLHNPFPSDYKGVAKSLGFIESILSDLLKVVEDAEKAVVEAWKAVGNAAAGLWDDIKGVWDDITGRKKEAEREYQEAKDRYNDAKQDLQNALNDLSAAFDEFKDILNAIADAVKPTPPVTIAEERETPTFGWAYMGLLARIAEDLGDFFKAVTSSGAGNWNNLYSDLMNETRVVHFVDRNPLGGFDENGGFTILATWTVPRGRTLHLGNSQNPDYTIVGDLWLQRGSTLRIQGSLFVEAPTAKTDKDEDDKAWNYSPTSGMTSDTIPTGTIYLEPGATLVVDGILYAQGDRDHGSINVTSPAGVTSPLSTAVLVGGDVRLPFGTGSGLTVDRMLDYVADDLDGGELKGLADDFFIPVLIDLPPQLAKLVGPFHSRTCWFSDYAVSLVLIDELVEFGLQGPWPIPLPYTNCWRNIFKPFSEIYEVELNFALGENLYTHSDWWVFGQGVVPVVPKVDPKYYVQATEEAFAGFSSDDLNPGSILKTITEHLTEVIPEFAEVVLEDAVQTILKNMVEEAAGGFEDPCASQKESESEQEEGEKKSKGEEFASEMLGKFEKKMGKMVGQIFSEYRDAVSEGVNDALGSESGAAKELPGVFLYCGGQMDIGENVPDKASGFFFGEGDVNIAAQSTFGSVVSRSGSVNIQGDLYYYPFFSKASLWNPQRPDTYGVDTSKVPGYFSEFVDVFQDGVYMLTPENGSTLSVGVGSPTKLAEGYK